MLLAFVSLVVLGVAVHEPWFDEAQAWLLARDASIPDLLTKYLRYEGHPPLWYLVLAPAAKLGLPYKSINVISAAIATCGVVLLLLMRSIPLVVRALVPFTYFVAYQYTIVSRSYVLLLPLLLLVLRIYPERRQKLGQFTLLLALISLVSLHGMSLAGALTLLYMGETWKERASFDRAEWRRHALAAGVLLANVGAVAWMLRPPGDLAIQAKLDFGFRLSKLLAVGWFVLAEDLYGRNIVTIAILVVWALWFHRRKALTTALALVGAILPISSIYWNIWHEGLFFLALLFAVLLAFERSQRSPEASLPARAGDLMALAAVVAWLVLHASWTARSLTYDVESAYSGSAEAATYLRETGIAKTKMFGFGFPCLALQPYFEENLFDNYDTSGGFAFWDWSTRTPWFYRPTHLLRIEEQRAWIYGQLARAPETVIVSWKFVSDGAYGRMLREDGRYQRIRTFEGGLSWKGAVKESEGYELWARVR